MGVSTVTISIEEFESLIASKAKIEQIKKVIDANRDSIEACSNAVDEAQRKGEYKKARMLLFAQDTKNTLSLAKIDEILG